MEEHILDLNTDYELLKTDSGSSLDTIASADGSAKTMKPSIEIAKDDMLSILKQIRDSQSSQCTKEDLFEYGKTIKKHSMKWIRE